MLDPKLLEILACPRCKGAVIPDSEHTRLACPACKLRYRVEDDIPIMLIEEAEPLAQEGTDGR
ncbi:MAG: Trm112 family protein [Candidatus Krumholzibacteria bacterium]|nr:Trm112 family protein [Candidatus Krumholzibacteria bacterium]